MRAPGSTSHIPAARRARVVKPLGLAGAALLLVLVLVAAGPTRATVINGDFLLTPLDFGFGGPGLPPPFLIGTPGPTTARFTYDTDAVAMQTISPPTVFPDGRVQGGSGRYVFTAPGSASLSITFRGETYSTTARPDSPIGIRVHGTDPGGEFFIIAPAGEQLGPPSPLAGVVPPYRPAVDPGNPLPAVPYLDFEYGYVLPIVDGSLPMESFDWRTDALVLLDAAVTGTDHYLIRFLLASPITITRVPEPPAWPSILFGATIGALVCAAGARRRRRGDA
jgi:hypothetical protein